EREWGGPVGMDIWAPSRANDEAYKRWWAGYLRQAASPSAAISVMKMDMEIDVRHVLPSIRVPTLILHRAEDRLTPANQGRSLARCAARCTRSALATTTRRSPGTLPGWSTRSRSS